MRAMAMQATEQGLAPVDKLHIGAYVAPLLRGARIRGSFKVVDRTGAVTREIDGNELVKKLSERAGIELDVLPQPDVCPGCYRKKWKSSKLCRSCSLDSKRNPARYSCPKCAGVKNGNAKVCLKCSPFKKNPAKYRCACGKEKSPASKVCKECWVAIRAKQGSFCPGCGDKQSRRKGKCRSCLKKERLKRTTCSCGRKKDKEATECLHCCVPRREAARQAALAKKKRK